MDIVSECQLRVGSMVWRSGAAHWLTVVCKATFSLALIESPLARVQEPINEDDDYWDDDETRSLRAPSDLVPYKARADVLLVGSAFAPNRTPVRSVISRLSVGEVDKCIEVFCDRTIRADGGLVEGARFARMPLLYERAAGGPGTGNPVGMRWDVLNTSGGLAVPNLQPPGLHITGKSQTFAPTGFGPIAPTWPGRMDRLGRYASGWGPRHWATQPLPEDLDRAYFNAAPRDQQLNALWPNQRIVLDGLSAEHSTFVTNLPGVTPRAIVERPGRSAEELVLVCDTLWLDTERSLAALVWRGQLELRRRDEPGRVRVLLAERRPFAPTGEDGAATLFLDDSVGANREALPFVPAPNLPPPPPPPQPLPSLPLVGPEGASSPWARSPWEGGSPPAVAPLEPRAIAPAVVPLEAPQVPRLDSAQSASDAAARAAVEGIGLGRNGVSWGGGAVELLWVSVSALARMRKHTEWKEPLANVTPRPEEEDLDDEVPPPKRIPIKDRRDVLAILSGGAPITVADAEAKLRVAVAETGGLVPPLVLVSGELSMEFDEGETLKATLGAVAPYAATDTGTLKATYDRVVEAFRSTWVQSSGSVLQELTSQLRAAFIDARRGTREGSLDAHIERALLEGRHYRKLTAFGQMRLRAWLSSGSSQRLAVYLPEPLAKDLPSFAMFPVRMVAEVRPATSATDVGVAILRALALGRVL